MEIEFKKRLKEIESKYKWFKLTNTYVRLISTKNSYAVNWTGEGINLPQEYQKEVEAMVDTLVLKYL